MDDLTVSARQQIERGDVAQREQQQEEVLRSWLATMDEAEDAAANEPAGFPAP
jgi:hypothetical protein